MPHLDELGEWRDARLLEESQRIFSPPVEIAEVAAHAGVARLVFSHKPPIRWPADAHYLWGVSDVFDCEVTIARDSCGSISRAWQKERAIPPAAGRARVVWPR